jgi:predicted TIM-barrel fold metal-dependent hydrolase
MIITYHMGISVGSRADLRYMNPADVSPIARDYNKTNFLFAHFATGYLQELLFFMYHVDNVYAETSSSNRWMDFMAFDLNLHQVFEKVAKASGTDHIIFGTDSTSFPRGWRKPIYDTQLAVCNQIGYDQKQINQIFYQNLERLVSNAL